MPKRPRGVDTPLPADPSTAADTAEGVEDAATAAKETAAVAKEAAAVVAAELAEPTGPAQAAVVSPRRALLRGRLDVAAITAALGAFAALFVVVKANRSHAIDVALTRSLQRTHHPAFDGLMRAVSWPGFPPQSRLIVPGIAASLWAAGLRLEAIFQLVAWGGALISTVVKAGVRRPRPMPEAVRVVVAPLGGTSFPSGHVLTYIGVYGFLAHLAHTLLRGPDALRRSAVAALVGLVALVGPSRIQQGHHWPTDVLASYLLGLPFLAAVVALYRRAKATAVPSTAANVSAVPATVGVPIALLTVAAPSSVAPPIVVLSRPVAPGAPPTIAPEAAR